MAISENWGWREAPLLVPPFLPSSTQVLYSSQLWKLFQIVILNLGVGCKECLCSLLKGAMVFVLRVGAIFIPTPKACCLPWRFNCRAKWDPLPFPDWVETKGAQSWDWLHPAPWSHGYTSPPLEGGEKGSGSCRGPRGGAKEVGSGEAALLPLLFLQPYGALWPRNACHPSLQPQGPASDTGFGQVLLGKIYIGIPLSQSSSCASCPASRLRHLFQFPLRWSLLHFLSPPVSYTMASAPTLLSPWYRALHLAHAFFCSGVLWIMNIG